MHRLTAVRNATLRAGHRRQLGDRRVAAAGFAQRRRRRVRRPGRSRSPRHRGSRAAIGCGLGRGQALGQRGGRFAGQGRFVDLRAGDVEGQAQPRQQFAPVARGRGQEQARRRQSQCSGARARSICSQLLVDAHARGIDRVADRSPVAPARRRRRAAAATAAGAAFPAWRRGPGSSSLPAMASISARAVRRRCLEGVGGVQELGSSPAGGGRRRRSDRTRAAPATTAASSSSSSGGGHAAIRDGREPAVCRRAPARGKLPGRSKWLGFDRTGGRGLTFRGLCPPNRLSRIPGRVPEVLDAWRMVAARRGFEGTLPLSSMSRLRDVLCDDDCRGRGACSRSSSIATRCRCPTSSCGSKPQLPLECQRSLQRFLHPVQVVQRLGLIRDEADEAGLPEGYEPLLVPRTACCGPRNWSRTN